MKHVDVNEAGLFELEDVFHDRQRAQEVLNRRELIGGFRSWADLQQNVHGMTDHFIEELSGAGVTVGSPHASSPRPRARPRTRHRATA